MQSISDRISLTKQARDDYEKCMLIGLLSDTHVRLPGTRVELSTLTTEELPIQIRDAFQGVELILHAGDIYSLPVLDMLETVAPVLAAEGDDDPFNLVNDRRCKRTHTLIIEGLTIWLSHYGQWPEDSKEKLPDIIVYGHSHRSALEKSNGLIRVNPGSPTFPQYRKVPGTVALMNIESGKADIEIVQLAGEITHRGTSGLPGKG